MYKSMISENISEKGKKFLRSLGFKEVDTFVSGTYEFYLLYSTNDDIYEIGMQRAGKEFTDMNQLVGKDTSNSIGKFSIDEIKRNIDKWLLTYHKIYCDSFDERKSKKWASILNKIGYSVQSDSYIDPMLGRAAKYITETRMISEMRTRRAPMFEGEASGKMDSNITSAMPNTRYYPNGDAYFHYRTMVMVSSFPDTPTIAPYGPNADFPFSSAYTSEEDDMIQSAAKLCGYPGTRLGTTKSKENTDINKVSSTNHNSGKHS